MGKKINKFLPILKITATTNKNVIFKNFFSNVIGLGLIKSAKFLTIFVSVELQALILEKN
jgi:hypothetical protein